MRSLIRVSRHNTVKRGDTMAEAVAKKKKIKSRTMFQEAWRHLIRNRGSVIGMIFLIVLVVAALISPIVFDYEKDVIGQNMSERLLSPGLAHWFGTDEFGRDLFARVIYGARYSLIIGVGSVFLGLIVGTLLGSLAGFYGGLTDSIIMRGVDISYSIPNIMTAVVIVSLLGTSTVNLMIALAFFLRKQLCANCPGRGYDHPRPGICGVLLCDGTAHLEDYIKAYSSQLSVSDHCTDHAADRYDNHLRILSELPWNRRSGSGSGMGSAAVRRAQPYQRCQLHVYYPRICDYADGAGA